ncbi:hypothetical protein N356_gp018 [Cellulophaga phage phi14:2]|uniref:Uncharacterized protein n=1 Tax=Cellulophaga phage phi14:2 TaxID=1327990 RepID=S0A281_9CAUD|nr:hypothetical protein N356_gp018 [Cellulophaga phage phi14:2]AGO48910.1 hypothetical protein Phi14:2_gp032 [Cellulophaga phage phi14:2]
MKQPCPMCMGSKEIFTGSKVETCNTCDDDGNVTQEFLDIVEHNDEYEGDF